MRTKTDAYRSVRRYVAESLEELRGETWEIVLGEGRGEFAFPYGMLDMPAAGNVDGPMTYSDITQAMIVDLYPTPKDTEDEALVQALEVEETLYQAFRVGHGQGWPARIPLWDYDEVPLHEESIRRGDHDYLRVMDFSSRPLVDVPDRRRVRVVADLRVGWRRRGRVPSGTQRVTEVRTEFSV